MDFANLGISVDSSSATLAVKNLDTLVAAGKRAEREIEMSMNDVTDSMVRAANTTAVSAERMQRQTRASVANLSYQITDIAQMLAAGQSPFILMMQQGDQVAGAMRDLAGNGGRGGIIGGIGMALRNLLNPVTLATYAVIGFGAYAVQWFLASASSAENLDKQMDSLNKRFGQFEGYAKVATTDLEKLTEKYGSAAAKARELNESLALNQRMILEQEVSSFMSDAADPFGLARTFKGLQKGAVAEFFGIERDFLALTESSREAREEVDALATAVINAANQMNDAEGLEEQVAALEAMRSAYSAAADASGSRSAAEASYIDTIGQLLDKMYQQIGAEENLAAARKANEEVSVSAAEASAAASEEAANRANAAAEAAIAEGKAQLETQTTIAATEEAATAAERAIAAVDGEKLAEQIQLILNTTDGLPVALSQMEEFSQRMLNFKDEFGSALDAIANTIQGFIQFVPEAFEIGHEIGKALVDGVIEGVQDRANLLAAVTKSLAERVNSTFKTVLQIRSPSRVFREHGQNIGEGLEQGLKDSQEGVGNVMTDIADGLTDAVVGLFDGSVKSAEDFLGAIKNIFKQTIADLVRMAISNPIRIAFGLSPIGGGAAFAGSMGGMAGGGGGGFLGLAGMGKGILGSFGSGGSILGMGGLAGGTGLFGGLGNALSGGIGNLFNIGANAAAAGGGLLASVGAAIPVLGAVALIFGLFRKKVTELDNGLRVTIDGLDTMVEVFRTTQTKRLFGLIKNTNTYYAPAEEAVAGPIEKIINDIGESVIQMSEAIGLGTSALDDFTYQMTLSTKGMTEEQASKAIEDELAKVMDAMAEAVLGLERLEYALEGETAGELLTRLSSSLTAVNAVFDTLGYTLYDVSFAGALAAAELVQLLGGIEGFDSATSAYYQAFYSEAERSAILTRQLAERMDELNLTMPSTRNQFRELVEAQDLTTESGRETWAALIALAGQFDAILPTLEGVSQVIAGMQEKVLGNLTNLITVIAAAQRENENTAREWRRAGDGIRSYIFSVLSSESALLSAEQERQFNIDRFEQILGEALNGNLEAMNDLPAAAKLALESASQTAETAAELAYNEGAILAKLREAGDLTTSQEQRHLEIAALQQEQIDLLTEMRDFLSNGGVLEIEQIDELLLKFGSLNSSIAGLGSTVVNIDSTNFETATDALITSLNELKDQIASDAVSRDFNNRVNALDRFVGTLNTDANGNVIATASQLSQMASIAGIDTTGMTVGQIKNRLVGFSQSDDLTGIRYDSDGSISTLPQQHASAYQALQTAINNVLAFDAATPGNLGLNGGPAILRIGPDGFLDFQADAVYGGDAASMALWRSRFWADGGLEDQLYIANAELRRVTGRMQNFGFDIPQYAGGGMHDGGLAIVGEEGPELLNIGPSRVYNADQTAKMMRGDDDQLREEMRDLRRAMVEVIKNTKRTTDIMRNWDALGLPLERGY